MKGLLFYDKNDIKFSNDVKEPKIKVPDELIIDIAYCGICGSDLHEYLDGPIFFKKASTGGDELSNEKLPLCLGHEFSGTVREIGAGVTTLKPGDHVVVEAGATCADRRRFPSNNPRINTATCDACIAGRPNVCHYLNFCGLGFSDGGLSERVVTSEKHAIPIPKSIPMDIAALIEPLSVAWHAVRLSGLREGDSAVVLGSGPIGLATVLALQGHKAGKIVVSEPAEVRRLQAANFGVETFNPFEYKSLQEGIDALKATAGTGGFQYSFDASGVQASLDTSIGVLAAGGKATNIAIWPDVNKNFKPMSVTLEEKSYCGSMCYTRLDFEQVIEAIHTGNIDMKNIAQLITGKVKLEDAVEKGFKELINNKDHNIKILITPRDI
ncbi:(R,R)-butanediol dehydrogenase [Saccharomycopsis crataegensis]|uniref:(R,R)-butanediol dehydrogenase n=1 Tax=Saccharomycopsis crataegensis TaxID=43959 RepID=A0AAV5QDV4_9ASCO|nr:(R,R)-butanediol dehydrogenase [Saccharomycopsis crataegensis]